MPNVWFKEWMNKLKLKKYCILNNMLSGIREIYFDLDIM